MPSRYMQEVLSDKEHGKTVYQTNTMLGILRQDSITIPGIGLFGSCYIPLSAPLCDVDVHEDGTLIICVVIYREFDMMKNWNPNFEGSNATDGLNQIGPATYPAYWHWTKLHGAHGGRTPVLYFGRKPGWWALWGDISFGRLIMNFHAFNDCLQSLEGNRVPSNARDAFGNPSMIVKGVSRRA